MDYEIKANKYCIMCIRRSIYIMLITLFLNEINVFIIDKYLVRIAAAIILLTFGSALLIFRIKGVDKEWVKYLAVFIEIVGISLAYVFISYHVILVLPLPFLMAAHYQEKKLTIFTYVVSAITVFVSVILNYQYGLCDMNQVALTTGVVWKFGNQAVVDIEPLTVEKISNVLLFFAFPRCLLLTLYAGMASSIAKSGQELHAHRKNAEKASKVDEMTGLFNKNEYLRVIKEEMSSKNHVGVIFLDINNLKYVNDNFGHEQGDELIIKLAKSIKYIQEDDMSAYRIGGDEFVILSDNATNARLTLFIDRWKRSLDMLNEDSAKVKCSAAYGFSYGKGNKINEIIEEADKNMYACKKEMKEKNF